MDKRMSAERRNIPWEHPKALPGTKHYVHPVPWKHAHIRCGYCLGNHRSEDHVSPVYYDPRHNDKGRY